MSNWQGDFTLARTFTLSKRHKKAVTNVDTQDTPHLLHVSVRTNVGSTDRVAGTKWKEHRKLFTPAFHFKILEEFVGVFNINDRIMIQKLDKHVNGPGFDIRPYISLCTLDMICGKHSTVSHYNTYLGI